VNERPFLKEIMKESLWTIMKFGGAFTGEEFSELNKLCQEKGYQLQWLMKEAHGGGRGARAWGYAYVAEKNLIEEHLRKRGIWEEFNKIPKAKQINRIQKFVGPGEKFPVKPRVKIGPKFKHEGLIIASPSFMKRCNIPLGAKTTGPTKGLIIPSPVDTNEWDIIVPENENKLKLSVEQLEENMMLNRHLEPAKLFSKNLKKKMSPGIGRNPSHGFDLGSLLNKLPSKEWLKEAKDIYEGRAENEAIADALFSYKTKDGDKKYTPCGVRILAGESLFKPDIWEEGQKALLTMVRKALQPRIRGIYGVVMPVSLLKEYGVKGEKKIGWITRFPWTLPVLTTVYVWEHCIFVDEELWLTYGGDYDGDQGAIFDIDVIDGSLVWSRNKEWIKDHMKMPEKKDALEDPRSMEDIIACQLDQFTGCGVTFNNAKIVVDAARQANWNAKSILQLEMNLQAIEVQPYIDGQKYAHAKGKAKRPVDLALQYARGLTKHLNNSKKYFRTIRGNGTSVENIIATAKEANPNSGSYYERVVALFKGWRKGK